MNVQITVFGAGYVGLSNAVFLARQHRVSLVDICESRVDMINRGVSPFKDALIEERLKKGGLNLWATTDAEEACRSADFVLIATPTNYVPESGRFDTTSIEACLEHVARAESETGLRPTVVIRSTIPIGYVEGLRGKGIRNVFFVPEFLREGRALYDNLHPSRIVVGDDSPQARCFVEIMRQCAESKNFPVLFMHPREAEAVKLFANTYLALRVAFFNELDSFAWGHGLNAKEIICGVTADPRIGEGYCNPSFGYGGYCLPKDTKQLRADYGNVPERLISAVIDSNDARKRFVAQKLLERSPKVVGVHRLIMKAGSDNFRSAAVFDVMAELAAYGVEVVVYEPTLQGETYEGLKLEHDFDRFAACCDVILANRLAPELTSIAEKVVTRDVFGRD